MAGYEPNLLAWQWSLYPQNHCNRTNLLLHILTVPVFEAGFLVLVVAPMVGHPSYMLAGLGAMAASMAAQGRGHRLEAQPPVPFSGPLDVVLRILAEQLITFPRFVLSGGFRSAWQASAPKV